MSCQGLVEFFGFWSEGVGEGAEHVDGGIDSVAGFEVLACGKSHAGGRARCDYVTGLERHQAAKE